MRMEKRFSSAEPPGSETTKHLPGISGTVLATPKHAQRLNVTRQWLHDKNYSSLPAPCRGI